MVALENIIYPSILQIGLQDGYCNLKCAGCLYHSPKVLSDLKNIKGIMPLEKLRLILEELKNVKPFIKPFRISEPLMTPNFKDYMSLIGEYEFPVSINTNGLLLTQDLAKFLVKIKLGSISFSIDAFTKETYKKTRGTYALESVKKAVFRMLEERRSSNYPRIGVSFLMNNTTMHEMNDFVSYWLKYVDVVRVAKMFDDEKKIEGEPFIKVSDNRLPCKEVYNTMSINYKGDVYVCCFDSFSEVFLGNVFEDGLLNVWNGEKVNSIRKKMIAKEFDKIDFCKNCILSREYTFEEKECEGVLIRKSPHVVFYNRVDKIASWSISSYLGENKYKQEVLT